MAPDNAARVVEVLKEFGFDVPDLSSDLFLERDRIVRMGVEPVRIEVTTTIDGVEFDDCYGRRIESVLDGVPASVIDLRDVKINKRASGRPQDLVDPDELTKINEEA